MSTLAAQYFDGRSARGHAVQLSCENGLLLVRGETVARTEQTTALELSPRLGRTRRRIAFPDGAVCELEDDALLDSWFDSVTHQGWNLVARLEGHWAMIAASFVLVMAMTAALAVWGLPWVAQKVAVRLPQEWVAQLGKGTLAALDSRWHSTTTLPLVRQQTLRAGFARLQAVSGVKSVLVFRDWPEVGPNAMALPDGTIIMTDELDTLATDDREVMAVLAHELGHVHERHALQQVIASSGVAALVFVLTGDVSGLSSIVVAAPTIMTHLHYSRALEADADRYGFALMSKTGLDPVWFARIIRKLEAAYAAGKVAKGEKAEVSDWLRTHPASEERAHQAEQYRAWH